MQLDVRLDNGLVGATARTIRLRAEAPSPATYAHPNFFRGVHLRASNM